MTNNRSYNYPRFRTDLYDLAPDGIAIGDKLPDLQMQDLDGNPVPLSEWRGTPLVIETGSVTCPAFIANVDAMNDLAEAHPDVAFVVIYTREAHPGRRIRHHDTTTAKTACARQLTTTFAERRTVLIDDINGTAHRVLGALPDMVYIIDANGTVAGRANWNDPQAVEDALRHLAENPRPGRLHTTARPDMRTAIAVLRRAGWTAVSDFAVDHLGAGRRTHGDVNPTPQ